jgi:hypothetical protein
MGKKKEPGAGDQATTGRDGTGVTVKRNNTTTGAKNQVGSAARFMAEGGGR